MKLGMLLFCVTFSFYLNAQPVNLGSTVTFGVLAGSTVTSTGPTIINGNLGVSPGTAISGFPPGVVAGGTIHLGDQVAAQGQSDLTTAYLDAAGRACPGPSLPGDIGGTTIFPGVYCNPTSVGITGTVTLNGNGNPNAVFIFQIGSTLVTATNNSNVNLINGAKASNVFWQVGSSATLGTHTIFNGTILAQASITITTGAVLNGRALARVGAVTLDGNAVAAPPVSGLGGLSLACSFPGGKVGQSYSSSLLATGGMPPYAYSISAGSMPPGLTLNASSGAITGTPTTPGAFSDTSMVVDSVGASATSSCGISIAPGGGGGALSLTCPSNSGQVGQPFTSALLASGGTAPYTYSIITGVLPLGLTLDASTGVISGTPNSGGSFNYTSRLVDSANATTTASCGPLIVAPAGSGQPPPTPAPPSLILGAISLACVAIYVARERLLRRLKQI